MSKPHKAMATNILGTARPSSQWDQDKEAPKSARAGWPLAGRITVLLGVARESNPYTGTCQANTHNIGNILPKYTYQVPEELKFER